MLGAAESFYVNGTYDVGVQTCLSLPLWIQSAPDDAITASLSRALLHDLMDTQDFHFTTGIIGLKYTLEVRVYTSRLHVAPQLQLFLDTNIASWSRTQAVECVFGPVAGAVAAGS